LKEYQWWDYKVYIPDNWNIIDNKENIIPKPKFWKIELSVTSKDVKNNFSNNILILSSTTNKDTTSKEFSEANFIWLDKNYEQYKNIENKELKFDDWESSTINIFEWKYNKVTPKLIFLQTAHICSKNKIFFITIALSSDTKDFSKYENIIKTFSCK